MFSKNGKEEGSNKNIYQPEPIWVTCPIPSILLNILKDFFPQLTNYFSAIWVNNKPLVWETVLTWFV